jgi:hypothetical protein
MKIVADPVLRQRLGNLGLTPVDKTTAEFAAF